MVAPPLPTIGVVDPFEAVIPEPEPIPSDDITGVEDDEAINVVDEAPETLDVDEEAHRDTDHNLVGCTIKAFYPDEVGWYMGKITWYATMLGKLRVFYEEDESDDYISPDEINGIDIILCT